MAVRQWMSRALGVIGLTALATGCADDGVSVHSICPITPTIADDACTWDSSSMLCVADGVLNVFEGAAQYYRLNLKVESGLKPRARDVPVLAETNGLQITRARVELRYANGNLVGFGALPNPFWASTSGYVAPMGTAIVPITIVGSEYVTFLRNMSTPPQIIAAVTLHGKTTGTEDVESDEFSWPIRIIKESPLTVARACVPIPYCIGSLGQDGFAQACKDSATSN